MLLFDKIPTLASFYRSPNNWFNYLINIMYGRIATSPKKIRTATKQLEPPQKLRTAIEQVSVVVWIEP